MRYGGSRHGEDVAEVQGKSSAELKFGADLRRRRDDVNDRRRSGDSHAASVCEF